jgi:hypothetical protein
MNQNYCFIEKNKIYGELFDELLEEELSMNKNEDNEKIKRYISNKIIEFRSIIRRLALQNQIIRYHHYRIKIIQMAQIRED